MEKEEEDNKIEHTESPPEQIYLSEATHSHHDACAEPSEAPNLPLRLKDRVIVIREGESALIDRLNNPDHLDP